MGFFEFIKSAIGVIFDAGKAVFGFFKNLILGFFKKKVEEKVNEREEMRTRGSRRTMQNPNYGKPNAMGQTQIPNNATVVTPPAMDELRWYDGTSVTSNQNVNTNVNRPMTSNTINPNPYMNTNTTFTQYNPQYQNGFYKPNNSIRQQFPNMQKPIYPQDDILKWHDGLTSPSQSVQSTNINTGGGGNIPWDNLSNGFQNVDINQFINKPTDNVPKPNDIVCAFGPRMNYVGNGI